jgi:hypothetical protein
MNFGDALELLKSGKKLAREGWNGKDQFIYYVPDGVYEPTTKVGEELSKNTGVVPYRAYLAIKTVQGDVVPWVASQSDLLSDDWMEV